MTLSNRLLFSVCISAYVLFSVWTYWLFPTWSIRYRFSIDVAVAGEVKHGTTVIETVWHDDWIKLPLDDDRPWHVDVTGTVLTVDLGADGLLFVLLRQDDTRVFPRSDISSSDPPSLLLGVYSNNRITGPGTATKSILSSIQRRYEPLNVNFALLPMFVRFRDITDPHSIERVDPRDFSKTYGSHAALLRSTVQIVQRGFWPLTMLGLTSPQLLFGFPINTGLDRRLPFTTHMRGYMGGNRTIDLNNPERNLTVADFIRGSM